MWEAIYQTLDNFGGYRMMVYFSQHKNNPINVTLHLFKLWPNGGHIHPHWFGWQDNSTDVHQPRKELW